ncbi:MAG TPA: MBL fold metallo-hydrolase [Candidatus Limnocylindrales bacterium]|nr:MBL fold metallo-hydrolase [Candidatus Limnocylindrales bacterium]
MTLTLTRFGHACVRLERDGRILVIDPGIYSEPQALLGADAVLVTHEHFDHVDRLRLAGLGAPVFAPAGADIPSLPFEPLAVGEEREIAGFRVRAVGGRHATLLDDQPVPVNLGYVIDGAVYHPGDSLARPDVPVTTVLIPAGGPWLNLRDAIGLLRDLAPANAFPIHDILLAELGQLAADRWLASAGVAGYRRLRSGESVQLD